MRYLWDKFDDYFGPTRPLFQRCAGVALKSRLQHWDRVGSRFVDRFVANSRFVRERIRRFYQRDADVIPPPVDCRRFTVSRKWDDFYLVVSALVPYKRVDLAVAACSSLGRKLWVVGDGGEAKRLQALAGPSVTFLGRRTDKEVSELLQRCRALVFPGEEDFGIVPLEAMASGRPVVAYGRGGTLETVLDLDTCDSPTGVFFRQSTVESLVSALQSFEREEDRFEPDALRRHAENFDRPRFRHRLAAAIEQFAAAHCWF